jgi:hypothetical protein
MPKYKVRRLADLDGWEFHEIFVEHPFEKHTISLRVHVELREIEYAVWGSVEKPLLTGASPYPEGGENNTEIAAEHVIFDILGAISEHRLQGEHL